MKLSIFSAFQDRSFAFLWLGEIFTQIAVNFFNFYLILVVFSLTHSNTAVAGIIVSFTIPAILFGIFAGAYVDRRDKKRVLYVTNIIRALLLLLLAFFQTNVIMLYIVSLLVAFVTQFFIPAETPIIPVLVKKDHLYSANALFSIAIYGSILIAYIITGPTLLALGQVGTLLALAGLLFLGALFITFIQTPRLKRVETIQETIGNLDIKKEVKHAFELMRRTKEIYHSLFLLALSQILLLIIAAITPGYATKVLGMNIEEFPIIFVTPAALGMAIGGVILVNRFHNVSKNKMVVSGLFLAGLAMLVLPYISAIASKTLVKGLNSALPHVFSLTEIHILIVLAFVLGFANALVFVPSNTLLQEKTADEFRGMIYGALNSIVGIFSLIPIIIVGSLSDLIGVPAVIWGIGICLLVIGFVRMVT